MDVSEELIGVLLAVLFATSPALGRCVRGDLAYLDGERVTQESVKTLIRLEGATGMHLTSTTGLVTALERRGLVAVAQRAGVLLPEGEAFEALEYMKVESLRPHRLQRALKVAGERAYVYWVVQPLIAERELQKVYRTDLRTAGEARARYVLSQAMKNEVPLRDLADDGLQYTSFSLSEVRPVIHAPPALRIEYERDMEKWRAGGKKGPAPRKPQHPIEEIPGLGIGVKGYVKDMLALAKRLKDGEFHRRPILDDETWLIMRRVRFDDGIFHMEGLKISPPNFQMWIRPRYGELDKSICGAQAMKAARGTAPGHPLMEWMK